MNRQIEEPTNDNLIVTSRSLRKDHPNNLNLYTTSKEFLDLLREVKIRFDTNPKFYQKEDFLKLIELFLKISGAEPIIDLELVDLWQKIVKGSTIPDGNLIKDTIEYIESRLGNQYLEGIGIYFTKDEDEDLISINANTNIETTNSITLSTGAPINALGIWDNDVIPQGTSVLDILEKLLNKEIFPSPATPPSIRLEGNESLGIKEIDTDVDIHGITMITDNGHFNPASYGSVIQHPVGIVSWSNKTITVEKTRGFTGNTQIDGSDSINSSTGIIILGENIVTYRGSATYSKPENKPITNLEHETESTSKISVDGSDLSATWGDNGNANAETKVTKAIGVYPCFVNISNGSLVNTITKDSKKIIPSTGAYTTSTLTKIYLKNIPGETQNTRFMFAFPAGRTVKFYGPDTADGYAEILDNTYEITEVPNFYGNKTYKVLSASKGISYYSGGISRCYFELSKGLDVES